LLRSLVFGAKAGEDFFSRDAIPAVCAFLNVSAQGIQRHRSELLTVFMHDAAAFAQRVRKGLGLTQLELSRRIDVSLDTIRNWEQGKRSPTGAARALLRVLDKAPEACLEALR
jgi:DNA-binding transcriptional regulator YiaG